MTGIRLLLVDDEDDFVTTVAERLQMRGFGVAVALSGTQALEMLADDVPDVIVLDVKMAGLDGLEVLRSVRSTHPRVPVILMTGHGADRDERRARRLGAFAYLRKPVAIEQLIDTIQSAATQSRAGTADHGAAGA